MFGCAGLAKYGPSPEEVMTRSDSLSLSSYSSWLLTPPALDVRATVCRLEGAPGRATLLRRGRGSCCTRKPVVTISSLFADDSEEDEGCELISIHESEAKKLALES